jgi:DNA-binding transcriptional regulator YhcF (GntR family)
MLPWKSIIEIDIDCDCPIYLQIANAMALEIKRGRIGPGIKLPCTRLLSETLTIHRKTIVSAYEELAAQGWIEMRPSQGTFTSRELPEAYRRKLNEKQERPSAFPTPDQESKLRIRYTGQVNIFQRDSSQILSMIDFKGVTVLGYMFLAIKTAIDTSAAEAKFFTPFEKKFHFTSWKFRNIEFFFDHGRTLHNRTFEEKHDKYTNQPFFITKLSD